MAGRPVSWSPTTSAEAVRQAAFTPPGGIRTAGADLSKHRAR